MKVQVVCMIVACTVMVDGQTGSSPAHKADEKQPAAGLYQRQASTRPHEQKDDFFTASTKLVNKNDLDSTRARWLRRRSRNTTGTWRNATG